MKKNDAFSYNVSNGEAITITVTPVGFINSLISVRAELDGEVLEHEPGSDNEPVFTFTVNKQTDDIHTLMMEFTFIAGTPAAARYDVSIEGENDQGCPCGFVVKKTSQDLSPDIEFVVV